MHLPSGEAAAHKAKIAETFARYLGGDVSLVNEVMHIQRMQQSLPPDHPARFFAQSVEPISSPSAYIPAPVEPEALTCLTHYAEGLRRVRDVLYD